MSQSYSLLVQRLDGFSWKPGFGHQKEPNLYVGIDLDGKRMHRTHTINRDSVPKWNDVCTLSPDQLSSGLSLHLYHKSVMPFKDDSCMATVNIDIETLSKRCGMLGTSEKIVALELVEKSAKVKSSGTLSVRLDTISFVQAGEIEIASAQKDAEDIGISTTATRVMGAADKMVKVQSKTNDLQSSLYTVISKLNIVVRVGDKLAQIHPYANVAWKVLTSVYEAVKQQQETDEKIIELIRTMATTYSFVEDIESLPGKMKELENTCIDIVKQTVECAIFIREYTGTGFGGRLVGQALSDSVRQRIDDLSTALRTLKESLDSGLAIQTAFVSATIKENVQRLAEFDMLKALNPVDMNAFGRILCLPGTRVDILNFIHEWLTTPSDSSNILWLYGVAGSGKSTISTTVSEYFRDLDRLGAFIFFDRNDRLASSPSTVLRTIAHQLAKSNPKIRSAICDAIKRDENVATATIKTQFKKLLLDPLKAAEMHINGPIIVVVDALDECGDVESRNGLVSLLSNEFHKLPSLFRFLITSRSDSDIANHFREQSSIIKMHLETSITADIELYIRSRMEYIRKQRKLESGWPGEDAIWTLTEYSDGLFIWASTATKFLDGHRPKQKLEFILRRDPTAGFNLDQLFEDALRVSGPWDDCGFAMDAQAVLAAIVLGKVPVADTLIDGLFNLEEDRSSRHILSGLGCVIQWNPGDVARTLHASFGDYLTDPERSGDQPWHLDVTAHRCALTLRCFSILKKELRFNICRLKDSHVKNSDVPNLSTLIDTYISPQLSYSSLFWPSHLTETNYEVSIQEELLQFLQNQYLFWLEVVSVQSWSLFHQDQALVTTLKRISGGADDELKNLVQDCLSFTWVFGQPILESAPHIYLSALAMAPECSLVRRQYLQWFDGIVKISAGAPCCWEEMEATRVPRIEFYENILSSLAFSPDGHHIVSGSGDSTLCFWDAETLQPLGEPLRGHEGMVTSIVFFPDGSRIVSGSKDCTLRIWDAETLRPLGEPLRGHKGWVLSVAFSPDRSRIVSGSQDRTLRIWNAETAQLLGEPLRGHNGGVWSVSFSPDGSRIVSGSQDHTLRIWDADTLQPLGEPLRGHNSGVWSVVFSPNGSCIVSGSMDHTLRIWDAGTLQPLGEPLRGHDYRILSVAFSPDSKHIVSASSDCTLQVWDAETRQSLGDPLYGHDVDVLSVAFSPCGSRIVSGAKDGTLRIWDMEAKSLEKQSAQNDHIQLLHPGKPYLSSSLYFSANRENQDGIWLCGPNNEHLLWFPYDWSSRLPLAYLLAAYDGEELIQFDDSTFHHGKEWTKCYTGGGNSR